MARSGLKPKDQLLPEVTAMAGRGMSMSYIARTLGISFDTVKSWLDPVYANKRRERNNELRAKGRAEKPRPTVPNISRLKRARPPGFRNVSALVLIAADPRDILNVTGCRWPVQDDPNVVGRILFCNADRDDTKSYCDHHAYAAVRHDT